MQKWKTLEMSKRLLIIALAIVGALFPVVVIATFVLKSPTMLEQYCIGAFGLASVAYGFYFWKAKNENLHKYAKRDSQAEIDAVERLAKELNRWVSLMV